jgi:hypothetical protein
MRGRTIVLTVLGLLLLLPLAVWSQPVMIGPTTTSFPSLESILTFGLYRNATDAAFDVNDSASPPTFRSLQQSYLFGGLTNPFYATTWASFSGPFFVGYHSAGKTPWSALGLASVDATTSTLSDGITPTYTNKVVGTTTYPWTSQTVDNQYNCLQDLDLNLTGGYLMALGPMNIGLGGTFVWQTNVGNAAINTFVGNNRTSTTTVYYDTAGAGAAPDPAENYTLTSVYSAPDSLLTIAPAVPFYIKLGNIGLAALLGVTVESSDQSTSVTNVYTAPQTGGAGTFFNVTNENSTTNQTGSFGISLDTIVTLPPLFGKHPDDRLELGLQATADLNTAQDSVDTLLVQDWDYTGVSGGTITPGAWVTHTVTTDTRNGLMGGSAYLSAREYMYFQPVEAVQFGLSPMLELGAGYAPPAPYYTARSVDVVSVDGDGDGAFTNALDTITTTTTEYFNNNDGGTLTIGGTFYLPVAVKLRPEKWPFGVTFGNLAIAGINLNVVSDTNNTSSVATTQVDGTGATVSSTTTESGTGYKTTRLTTNWNFGYMYFMVLNVFLPAGITMDVILNGANLLEFESLAVQLIIPMP